MKAVRYTKGYQESLYLFIVTFSQQSVRSLCRPFLLRFFLYIYSPYTPPSARLLTFVDVNLFFVRPRL